MKHDQRQPRRQRWARLPRLRPHLTYANVTATLALFLVLGSGTAYAGHLIVNGSDVVDDSLFQQDLGRDSVAYDELAFNSVVGAHVRDGSVKGIDIVDGSLTERDVAGGIVRGWERKVTTAAVYDEALVVAVCPSGKKVLGGGFARYSELDIQITQSQPSTDNQAWRVYARNDGGVTGNVDVYAICASVS